MRGIVVGTEESGKIMKLVQKLDTSEPRAKVVVRVVMLRPSRSPLSSPKLIDGHSSIKRDRIHVPRYFAVDSWGWIFTGRGRISG